MFNFKKYKDLVYDIIGSAMTVHRELNWGLLEPVYNEALYMELLEKGINCESEKLLPCYYKGHRMEKYYKMDLVVDENIIIEAIICSFYKQGLLTEKEYSHIMDSLTIGKAW